MVFRNQAINDQTLFKNYIAIAIIGHTVIEQNLQMEKFS